MINCMKTIFKSKDVIKYIKQQKEVNEEIGEVNKELVALDKKRNVLQFKLQRIKDRGRKELDKVVKKQAVLDPLDYLGALNQIDEENFEVEVHNVYKDSFSDMDALIGKLLEDKKNKANLWSDPAMFTGHKE